MFGVTLLDRSRRPLVVTPAGQLYQEFCRDVLRRREEFEAALGALKNDTGGAVRVASIYSVGLSEMVELERRFAQRHPQATLEVQYLQPAKVYAAVLAEKVDLGLVSYPHATREIKVIPWRQEEMVLATAPDHPLAKKATAMRGPLPIEELNGVDFVGFDEELPIRSDVDRYLKEKGVEVNVTVHFDNIQMIKEAVEVGQGISILPARTMQAEIEQGRLAAVKLHAPELARPVGIVHRRRKKFNRAAEAFLEMLRGE